MQLEPFGLSRTAELPPVSDNCGCLADAPLLLALITETTLETGATNVGFGLAGRSRQLELRVPWFPHGKEPNAILYFIERDQRVQILELPIESPLHQLQ